MIPGPDSEAARGQQRAEAVPESGGQPALGPHVAGVLGGLVCPGGEARASPPDMWPCSAVKQGSRGSEHQPVHLGHWPEGSAQVSLSPFLIGEFPGCGRTGSPGDFSQRSERKV